MAFFFCECADGLGRIEGVATAEFGSDTFWHCGGESGAEVLFGSHVRMRDELLVSIRCIFGGVDLEADDSGMCGCDRVPCDM